MHTGRYLSTVKMDMHTHLSLVISGLCLLLLSTGCGKSTTLVSANNANITYSANGGTPVARLPARLPDETVRSFPLEVFDAKLLPGVGPGMITINADLPANITVVAFPSDAVGLDYMTLGGVNASEQVTAAEAHKYVVVSLERVTGGAEVWARRLNPAANGNDTVKLHVRVPHNASLEINTTEGGVIKVSGPVNSIYVHTAVGPITVDGAIGPVNLTTDNGAINVDAFAQPQSNSVQQLEMHAANGDINVMAVGANVQATTTEGNIRFIGSLIGDNNSFMTSGTGRVLATLPSDLTYRFDIESKQRVVNDFIPATLICAMATSQDTRMWTEASPDLIGQIEASDSVVTTTYSVLSVAGRYQPVNQPERPYLFFADNHSQIKRFSPEGDVLPNGGNAAQAFWSPDCDAIRLKVEQNAQPLAARLRIKAENGDVLLRLIRKH
jgi:hypothetical protein